jgi:RNA ligase
MVCRGLIVDDDDTVLARPWRKFFNHTERPDDVLALDAPVEVTDKADGSLAILYPTPDGPAIATRGSFASEQAQHASALYRERYAGNWQPTAGWTYLFEIIYPANRIVLDYGSQDDLVLLGAVEIATGTAAGPLDPVGDGWPGPRTEVHAYRTLAEALAAEPRPNAEGLVVRYLPDAGNQLAGTMVKLKQADYVVLHRIVTGLTGRRLWERSAVHAVLADDPSTPLRRIGQVLRLDLADVQGMVDAGPDWLEQVRQSVPEEFLDWIEETTTRQVAQVAAVMAAVESAVAELSGLERKEIATRIAEHPHRGMIFAALDGRSVLSQAWSSIRPPADRAFGARGEDVA